MGERVDLFNHDEAPKDNTNVDIKVKEPAYKHNMSSEEIQEYDTIKAKAKQAYFEDSIRKLNPKDITKQGAGLLKEYDVKLVSERGRSLAVSNTPNQQAVSDEHNKHRLEQMRQKFDNLRSPISGKMPGIASNPNDPRRAGRNK